jgi:hypothetical protein
MRILLLAAVAIALANCAAPTMTAMNAPGPQQAAGPNKDEQPRVPAALHRPPRTIDGWGTTGSGGMY